MTFHSIPHAPKSVKATQAQLDAIYHASKKGLRGDNLALAAHIQPTDYNRLIQFDQDAELAELKGRADAELELSNALHEAALNGDAKSALEILKHQHGWKAAQSLEITVEGRISVLAALEKAQTRVIQGLYTEVGDAPTSPRSLTNQQTEIVDGYQLDNARTPAKSTDV